MAADIDVINAALSKLGEQVIVAVSDSSPPARLANQTYADIRDSLLREYAWNFATQRASIAVSVTTPDWGYAYAYDLPATCLRLIEINNASDVDWRNEAGTIVTDIATPLQIRFIGTVTVDEMDATFRECLAARCAMEWAEPLSQTTSVGNQMAALYRNKLQVARVADGQEDRIKIIEATDFLDARFGTGGFRGPASGDGTPY
jgi:hypothetical protein